jgi:hypothetical protein
MDDESLVKRLIGVANHQLTFKKRDNAGAVCGSCNWPILYRPEFDFPDRTDETIKNLDPVVCICGEEVECEFCGKQLHWVIEEFETLEESLKRMGEIRDTLGVDVNGITNNNLTYAMCESNHPQGPLPRPPHTVHKWWREIQAGTQKERQYDAPYFNEVMSCFEVYYKIELNIAAVNVGLYLAWDLSGQDFHMATGQVLEMIEGRTHTLDEDEKICLRMDISALKVYNKVRKSLNQNGISTVADLQEEIDALNEELESTIKSGHNPDGAPQFIAMMNSFIEENDV